MDKLGNVSLEQMIQGTVKKRVTLQVLDMSRIHDSLCLVVVSDSKIHFECLTSQGTIQNSGQVGRFGKFCLIEVIEYDFIRGNWDEKFVVLTRFIVVRNLSNAIGSPVSFRNSKENTVFSRYEEILRLIEEANENMNRISSSLDSRLNKISFQFSTIEKSLEKLRNKTN